jgi:hypothetical protein
VRIPSLERLAPYVGHALGVSENTVISAYRPATECDVPSILDLRRRVNADMWWDDGKFVQWRYFSRLRQGDSSSCWIFAPKGEVLAACGLEPVTLVIDGVPVSATRTLDIMVRPELDGLGLGALMNLVLFNRFPIVLVTGSNAKSQTLLTRMFHHATDLRFWKTTIRSRAIIDEKFRLGPFSSPVAVAADLLLATWRARRRHYIPPGVTIQELTRFDSRVNELSRQCERDGRVLVRRDDDYLNWRFVENPRCRYRLFGAVDGARLQGYVVSRFNRARKNERREAEIVDWLVNPVRPDSHRLLSSLIHTAVDKLSDDGARIVSCAAVDSEIEPAMRWNSFRFRAAELLPFFVKAQNAALHQRLSVGTDWFLTRGDFDVE